jgi:hypothetical protein
MATPTEDHWRLALGVVRYLSVTPTCGLTYGGKGPELTAYCDVDYAGDVDSRRSTTGYVFIMHGGAVSWSSRLQPTVAASTVEAEYKGVSECAVNSAVYLALLLSYAQHLCSILLLK